MRVLYAVMLAVCALQKIFAFDGDKRIGFYSNGPDCYENGNRVADGECYALVWVKSGTAFNGFLANGCVCDPANNDLVMVAPSAKDGHSLPVNFDVPADYVKNHLMGDYMVLMLDTRRADGTPAALDAEGRLQRVNYWGIAKDSFVTVKPAVKSVRLMNALAPVEENVLGVVADQQTDLPEDIRRPRIVAFSVRNGIAHIEASEVEDYCSYGVGMGEKIGEMGAVADVCEDSRNGLVSFDIPIDEAHTMFDVRVFRQGKGSGK